MPTHRQSAFLPTKGHQRFYFNKSTEFLVVPFKALKNGFTLYKITEKKGHFDIVNIVAGLAPDTDKCEYDEETQIFKAGVSYWVTFEIISHPQADTEDSQAMIL